MKINNTTKISLELIQAIAQDVGFNMKLEGTLEIEYRTAIKGGMKDELTGGFYKYLDTYCIELNSDASTETLAHELRHAAQCQALGWEEMDAMYQVETEAHGYEGNIFEVDAREAGKRWKV